MPICRCGKRSSTPRCGREWKLRSAGYTPPISKEQGWEVVQNADAILVPGGFGSRGIEGKIMAARYARENKIPYLGLCLGMQVMCIDFARNVLDHEDANSSEFDRGTEAPRDRPDAGAAPDHRHGRHHAPRTVPVPAPTKVPGL